MRSDSVVLQGPLKDIDAAVDLVAVGDALLHEDTQLVLHFLQGMGLDEELQDLAPEIDWQHQMVH